VKITQREVAVNLLLLVAVISHCGVWSLVDSPTIDLNRLCDTQEVWNC